MPFVHCRVMHMIHHTSFVYARVQSFYDSSDSALFAFSFHMHTQTTAHNRNISANKDTMGNEFTAEQVDSCNNVGEIIAVVREEISALKVRTLSARLRVHLKCSCKTSLNATKMDAWHTCLVVTFFTAYNSI